MSTNRTARLLQLSSQALPIGAYAYSSGLEAAIATGQVTDASTARSWIGGVLSYGFGLLDLPGLMVASDALRDGNIDRLQRLNDFLRANRESAELLLEDIEMGKSLHRLLRDLNVPQPPLADPSFVIGFAAAGRCWDIDTGELARGYAFSWLENQVGVAVKTVPLGQTDAQIMLGELIDQIDPVVEQATLAASQDELTFGASMPALAMMSCWHEVQEARLYRS